MSTMRLNNMSIGRKLHIAYGLFLLPVAFLFYVIVDKSFQDIGFAQKEILGARYIAKLHEVQASLVRGETKLPDVRLADQVAAAEHEFGIDMGTAAATQAVIAALKSPADDLRQQSRAAVRDLISKVADGSNLTLDPDLDSYYVMDATTGKIPDLTDRLFSLGVLTASYSGEAELTAPQQAEFLVQAGGLAPVLEGLGASFDSAFKANSRSRAALAEAVKSTQNAVEKALVDFRSAALEDRSRATGAVSRTVPALSALSALDQKGLTELVRLLDVRIGGFRASLAVNIGVALALFITSCLFIFVAIQRGAVRPLIQVTARMRELAEGNKTIEIPGSDREDEIGQIATAVRVFRENMTKADGLAAEQQGEQVRKEKRQQAIEGYIGAFESSVAGALATLASASTQLGGTARAIAGTATKTSQQATTVAAASEQASANVQTVARATEELSSSIAEIGRQVSESTRITIKAVDEANHTNVQIQGLAEAAQKIGDVVKLISDIAGQTNLLALNATIEAARAGEAGKGFAVVASEVKSLANQTAKATEDISARITEIQSATGQSVQAIQAIGRTIGGINEISSAVAAAVEEQGAATKEIARNVQQAAAGATAVSSNIGGVTQSAQETGAGATEIGSAAAELAKQGDKLRGEVDRFLANIRAA
jgi:methyl-accepting chemotaxis protein